jgi:hypothetical protein
MYTHVALQFEVCDYPWSSLFAALAQPGTSLDTLRDALLADLISAFIDAAYFKEYTMVLQRRARDPQARVPVHRFGRFALNPDIYRPPPTDDL